MYDVQRQRKRQAIEDDVAYSRTEAQRRLGNISKQTFRQLVRSGQLRVKHAGRRILVPRSSIVAFLSDEQK
jgi:excisionase family DNA binding protein